MVTLKKLFIFFVFVSFAYGAGSKSRNDPRDRIIITGSYTMFPFAKEVSKRFTEKGGRMAPDFKIKGTMRGFATFCRGESDINMASRAMGMKRRKACRGVQYLEITVGYDAIALIIKRGLSFNVTRKSLYYALAERIPVKGLLVPNDILFWRDVLEEGYSGKITFYGPTSSSGTLGSFIDLVMYYVGNKLPTLSEYRIRNTKDYVRLMTEFRKSVWTTIKSGNEADIVENVVEDAGAVGIISLNHYLKAQDRLDALSVDGFAYNNSNLKTRRYPLIRPLYLYVNIARVKNVANIGTFVEEFLSDAAVGSQGYLTEMGLLQLTQEQLEVSRRFVRYLKRAEGANQ